MSPRRTQSVWTEKADKILSDAQWHNGPDLVWELMKTVPPGHALREVEAERVIDRAGGLAAVEELAAENPDEPRQLLLHRLRQEHPRRSQISDDALIQSGRSQIIRSLVREKVRSGGWEIRGITWPPTRDQWRKGDWEIRDKFQQSRTLTQLSDAYGMTPETLRKVIAEFNIPTIAVGRRITRIHIDHIVELDRAVEKFQQAQRHARTRQLLETRQRALQEQLDHGRLSPDRRGGGPSHPSTPPASR